MHLAKFDGRVSPSARRAAVSRGPVGPSTPVPGRRVDGLREVETVGYMVADPALQAQLRAQGMEPANLGPQAFAALMEAGIVRYRDLSQRARIVGE